MKNQGKNFLAILFFVLFLSTFFFIKNSVLATIDTSGNIITWWAINSNNISNYEMNFIFSWTLDVGDIATLELIDSASTSISQTYTGAGSETGVRINFNATTLTGWTFTMCGTVADSWGLVLAGPVIETNILDIELPTFSGVTSGDIYTWAVSIIFSDNNPGVTATLNSVSYTSGDQIASSWTYTFILTDAVGNSTGATFEINLPDLVSPTASVEYTPASWSRTSGNVEVIVTWFNETITGLNATGYTFTGNWTFTFTFEDLAGNTWEAIATVNRIDKEAPTFSWIVNWATYTTGVIIEFSDNNTWVTATLSGSVYTSGALITWNGTYVLEVTDIAGNSTGATFTLNIDYTPPTANVEYTPTSWSRTSGNVEVIITWFNETVTWLNATGYTFTGNWTFTFTFEDLAGNTWEVVATVSRIDKISPTASVEYLPASWSWTNQNVVATLTWISETLSGLNAANYTFTGNWTFTFTFEDLAGNTWEAVATVNRIDTTSPTFAGVTSWAYYSGDQAITFDDTYLSWATLNGIAYASGDSISTEGVYIFIVSDLAGNSTGATFVVDKTQPTFAGAISWAYYSGNKSLTFSDTNLSGATLDGASYTSWASISSTWTHTFIVSDKAGNSTGVTFIIDKTKPIFAGVATGAYYSWSRSITFSDDNLSGATLSWIVYASGDLISADGRYVLIVTDLAGNWTGATFTIDTIQPTFTGVISWTYYTANKSIWFSDTNLSGATLNGVTYTSGTSISIDATYIFIVRDKAGNSTGATFVLDKTKPTIGTGLIVSGNTGANGSTLYYNWTINIQSTVSDTGAGISWATCEYTTGSVWDTASYSSGYCYVNTLTPNTTISVAFRVRDIANNLNTGWTQLYTYDATAPITTDDANSITGNVDVTVTLSPIDVGVGLSWTHYCIDTWWTCTPTLSWTSVLVSGTTGEITHNFVRYFSVDKLNTTETTKTSVQINIDKENPYLTGTTIFSWNNVTNTGYAKVGNTITVLFQSHELLSALPTLTISGTNFTGTVTNIWWNNYSGSYVMKSTDSEGIISFNVGMFDLVGNTWTVTITSAIIFDRTNPAWISVTNPTSASYFQWGTVKTITWNTGSEINFWPLAIVLQYSNDWRSTLHSTISSGTSNNGTYNWTFPVVDSTLASVRIIATDLAGNTATFTGSQFVIDSTFPTDVEITFPSWGEYFKWWSWYLVTRSGGTDSFLLNKVLEYSATGSFPWTTAYTDTMNSFSYLRTAPSINSSGVKLRITITDQWWLTKTAQTAAFYIDSTAPTAISFTDNSALRRHTSATGTGTSTDALAWLRATGVVYRTDIAFTGNCNGWTTTPPTFTADGVQTGYACVMDKAGNIRTGQQVYKIDTTPPLLSMWSDISTNTGIAMNITATGDVSGISWYTRTKLSGTGTVTFSTGSTAKNPTVSASSDDTYVLQLVVKDNANNVTTGTLNFVRHTTPPVLTGASSVLNTTTQTPNYSFTGDEAGTISYSGSCSSSTTSATVWLNTITFSTLSNATYSTCKLRVTDSAGNASSWLTIPTFTVSYTAPSGWWGWGGGWWGGWLSTCMSSQLMCVRGVYLERTGVYCQWGDLNKACGTDVCVDGDYSGSPSDGLCKDPTKVEASTGAISTSTGKRVTFSSPFNRELTDAYFYAYNAKITTVNSINYAQMTWILIRSHLSKMMSQYAVKVLWLTPDTSRSCIFSDMQNQSSEFKQYAIMACQLGLMGLKTDGTPADKFYPNEQVNRAIFGTTLSRALRWDKYNGGQNRYAKHLDALYASQIITSKDKPFNRELRGYVMLMMMRADKNITKSSYLTFTSLRWTQTFVPNTTTTTNSSQFTQTELTFIKNINKSYQFTEGYTAGQASAGVKYLQYFLKAKKIYTGSINGINTTATLQALFQWQSDNSIVSDQNDAGAWYLWPATREIMNPLLKKLLNPLNP